MISRLPLPLLLCSSAAAAALRARAATACSTLLVWALAPSRLPPWTMKAMTASRARAQMEAPMHKALLPEEEEEAEAEEEGTELPPLAARSSASSARKLRMARAWAEALPVEGSAMAERVQPMAELEA